MKKQARYYRFANRVTRVVETDDSYVIHVDELQTKLARTFQPLPKQFRSAAAQRV